MTHLLHKAIVWYLRRCGAAFHCFPYGPEGRYVVLMTEGQFHRWKIYEGQFWPRRQSPLAAPLAHDTEDIA